MNTDYIYICICFLIRTHIQCEYADLKRQIEEFTAAVEEARNNPTSKYDASISKQDYFNDTLAKQVNPLASVQYINDALH